jgi:hypothetical protein
VRADDRAGSTAAISKTVPGLVTGLGIGGLERHRAGLSAGQQPSNRVPSIVLISRIKRESKSVMRKMSLLLCVLLAGCQGCSNANGAGPERRPPLKIGLVTWLGYGPFYIAKEKGFLEENKVDVELERIEGDVERRAAIASGRLDGIGSHPGRHDRITL